MSGVTLVQGDYVAEAKDEPSIYRTYLGERKREFYFDFITAEEVQDVADELLEQNKHIKVYYDTTGTGNPYIKMLDKSKITAPKCSVDEVECQIIRIDHTVEAGRWETILGMVADLVQVARIPYERLDIDNVSGVFEVGEAIVGGESGAVGTIKKVEDDYIEIEERGTVQFVEDEEITGGDSGATADVDNAEGTVGLVVGKILHVNEDSSDHLDAGYYIEQAK
ncbi:hypothetical protein KAR91_38355 [Candidatus Pacearchaeota archaeon]|nr:hypothetical protein [Candidatus Pacearchaeota archaeon]